MKKILFLCFLISAWTLGNADEALPHCNLDLDNFQTYCPAKLEFDGKLYEVVDWAGLDILFKYEITKEYGYFPPGLYFKTLIKNSKLYITETGICFVSQKKEERTKIPLRFIFPDTKTDTVFADFLKAKDILLDYGDRIVTFLIKNGEIFRSSLEDSTTGRGVTPDIYERFSMLEVVDCNDDPDCTEDPQNSKFISLMNRLKPYYRNGCWDLVQEKIKSFVKPKDREYFLKTRKEYYYDEHPEERPKDTVSSNPRK